jgi:hypothetical protein
MRHARWLALLVAVALAACGRANIINRDRNGGTIRYEGDRSKAAEHAQQLMAQQCGVGNYRIVWEGEEKNGADVQQTQDGETKARTTTSTQPVTSARDAMEYHVRYQCGAFGSAAGGSAATPAGDLF